MILAKNILNEVADRLGWEQIDTIEKGKLEPETRKLLRLLNRVLETVGGYNDWPMLRTDGSIVTVASLTTDANSSEYVTATQDNDSVTVAGQSFNETFIGRAFQSSGDEYIYRIIDVTSPTTLQLHRAWVSASITVADERVATIAQDRYALPTNFDRMVDALESEFGPKDVEPLTINEFMARRRGRQAIRLGDPAKYVVYGLNDAQSAQIMRLDPYPENKRLISYQYQMIHPAIDSDQDKILYPSTYIGAFIDILLQLANRDYDDNAKFQAVLQEALRAHNMQQANPGTTDSRARFEPANTVRRSMRSAYGFPMGNVDWGEAFETGAIYGL